MFRICLMCTLFLFVPFVLRLSFRQSPVFLHYDLYPHWKSARELSSRSSDYLFPFNAKTSTAYRATQQQQQRERKKNTVEKLFQPFATCNVIEHFRFLVQLGFQSANSRDLSLHLWCTSYRFIGMWDMGVFVPFLWAFFVGWSQFLFICLLLSY